MEYRSQLELYNSLVPALNVKLKMLKLSKYSNITREDIWNYLKNSKWKFSVDLTLADMVNDIIHTDNVEFYNYKKNNWEIL